MLKKRNSSSLAWGFFALMMSAVAVAADDPREWLERMNNALTTRNYDGTFAYWRGDKVEMLRIIHRVKNGQVSERLVSLDGSGREFIRTGNELACYFPDQRTVRIEKRPENSPLLGSFPRFDQASTAFYDIKQVGRVKLYRRDTRVISVTPKDSFRYGYKLWIDEGTAMPLRTQLCDARGRPIEQLVVAEDRVLRINADIPDSAFLPEVSTEGFRVLRPDSGVGPMVADTRVSDRWDDGKLPPGFRITLRAFQAMPGASGPVRHIVFSDGITSISVFVEAQQVRPSVPAGSPEKAPGSSTTAQAAPGTPQESGGVTQFGSTSAFSTFVEGRKVTALGEAPPETVRAIANAFRSLGQQQQSQPPTSGPRSTPGLSLQAQPPR
jgi:sigma-E factor negative regulatory protein RseB